MKLHINDPEKIARRALELTVNDTSDLQHDTRAGLGRSERALAHGIIGALCETLRSMFEDGMEQDFDAKASADEKAAEDLSARERELEERELALAQRMAASGIEPPNESLALIAEVTGEPTGNPEAVENAKLQDELRVASLAAAKAKASDALNESELAQLSYAGVQDAADELNISRTDEAGKMKKKATLIEEILAR